MTSILIDDHDLLLGLVERYLDLGYYPVPTGGANGKVWLRSRSGFDPRHPVEGTDSPPPRDAVLEAFSDNPGCGLSIAVPYLRDGRNDLLAIDIDIDDAPTLDALAAIIGMPCPVKRGSKGATFFIRYPEQKSLVALFKERELPIISWIKQNAFGLPRLGLKKAGDLLGMAGSSYHTVIPPTLHPRATAEAQSPVHYQWIPFPGQPTPLRLSDVPPSELPELEPYQFLMFYQWLKNHSSALWKYVGNTSPGDHHGLMLSASTYLWHEKFTIAEIEAICNYEASRTAEDERVASERESQIKDALRVLPSKIAEPKPAAAPRGVRGPKIPRDREMFDFLREKYLEDDLAQFNGVPYHWNDGYWRPMLELRHTDPWAPLYRMLINTYADANHAATGSALKSFANMVPPRDSSPDPNLVPFANGLVDVRTLEIRPQQREDFIPATLPYDYAPDTACPLWESFLHNLMRPPLDFNDQEDYEESHVKAVQTVEEYLGYCLVQSHSYQKMMFIIGKTGTGKSVLMKVVQGLLPKGWVTSVPLDQFDDPNARVQMAASNINISGEVGRKSRDVDEALLKVTAGEPVTVKILYSNKAEAVLPSRLIFHGNLPPDTTDVSGAIARRMIMLRCTDIQPSPVPEYEKKLLREGPGILTRLTLAYKRLQERGFFDLPSYAITTAEELTRESNSVSAWLDDCCISRSEQDGEHGTHSQELYDHYTDWCQRSGMYRYSIVQWGKFLTALGYPSRKQWFGGTSPKVLRVRMLKTYKQEVIGY